MITRSEFEWAQKQAVEYMRRAGIVITPEEAARIEVADCGLGEFARVGLLVLTYVNTERVCAKELVLLPGQSFPEHRHPPVAGQAGKEETFRCRWGTIYLYVPGDPAPSPHAQLPEHRRQYHTVWREIVLNPGEQYTLMPNTPHWFQGGPQGAIVSEFSTHSDDASDIFTDPKVQRLPVVSDT